MPITTWSTPPPAGSSYCRAPRAWPITTYYVQYAPSAAKKIPRARALGSPSQITCALRYIEDDPAAGKGRHVYIRKCNLVPGGEAQLKSRDTEQQMAFTATVQLPGGGAAAMIVDGEEL